MPGKHRNGAVLLQRRIFGGTGGDFDVFTAKGERRHHFRQGFLEDEFGVIEQDLDGDLYHGSAVFPLDAHIGDFADVGIEHLHQRALLEVITLL